MNVPRPALNTDLVTTTAELSALCERLRTADYVTVDTEFMRENTFWPRLCLIQVGGPDEARAIDPMSDNIDLAPLFDLMANHSVLKVFHAARQDIEIFLHLSGRIPEPLFDTQVAAMVCGYGESVSYETLVAKIARASLDKSSRFTDWARRPLTDRQLVYALGDVTHLRDVYDTLSAELDRTERTSWLDEEMSILMDPATYRVEPANAWRRIKTRTANRRFLGVLKAIAAWREVEAQLRDLPRGRILKDDALLEIAAHPPVSVDDLKQLRGVPRGFAEGRLGQSLVDVVARAESLPEAEMPDTDRGVEGARGLGPLVELLKVVLKAKCEAHDVAQKLVANSADLERIAAGDPDVPALHGWRLQIFGADAIALKEGRLALAAEGKRVKLVRIEPRA